MCLLDTFGPSKSDDVCDRICERDHIPHSQIFDEFLNFHIYDSETVLSKIQVRVLILKSVVLSIPGIYTFVILAFFRKACHDRKCHELCPETSQWYSPI